MNRINKELIMKMNYQNKVKEFKWSNKDEDKIFQININKILKTIIMRNNNISNKKFSNKDSLRQSSINKC